jgi:hypothetical protein
MLLQEIKTLSIFLPDFLLKLLQYELGMRLGYCKTTYSAVLFIVLERNPQMFQTTCCHACQADKDSIRDIGPNTMNKSRMFWEKIYNTWDNALKYVGMNDKLEYQSESHLQYVIKCVSVCELCCCDTIEVL